MTARRSIMGRSASAPVRRILRGRVGVQEDVEQVPGGVVAIRESETFAIDFLKESPRTINKFRGGEYLHVSDVLGKCVRRIALSEMYNLSMPDSALHESMALTFAQGTAIHDYIKQRFIDGHPEKMYGQWSCTCGKLRTGNMTYRKARTKKCGVCDSTAHRYHELELRDPEWMVVGSPDITLYLAEYGVYYPIEIKSIAHEAWKELARPQPAHILQVVFYWLLLKRLGYAVPSQVSILYATKGFLFQTPYKEFIVKPESVVSRLDDYVEEIRMLNESRTAGVVPSRTFCSSPSCSDAKACHVANLCFQID